MGVIGGKRRRGGMATRWRQRRMCVLVGASAAPAAIREISARGAFLETNERPELGARVELRHPEAGCLTGIVAALAADGVSVTFCVDARSVAFALAATAADMSSPDQSSTHSLRG